VKKSARYFSARRCSTKWPAAGLDRKRSSRTLRRPQERATAGPLRRENDTAPALEATTSPWPSGLAPLFPCRNRHPRRIPARYRQLFRQIKFHRPDCEGGGHGTRCVSASPRWSAQPVSATQKSACSSPCFFRLFCCAAISPESRRPVGPRAPPRSWRCRPRRPGVPRRTGMFVPPEIRCSWSCSARRSPTGISDEN